MRDTAWYIWFGEPVALAVRYRISFRMSFQLFMLESWRREHTQTHKRGVRMLTAGYMYFIPCPKCSDS